MVRNSIKFLVIVLLLTSCSSKYLFYSLRMTHPVINKSLHFENDTFAINFEIDKVGIHEEEIGQKIKELPLYREE